jgi:hypothetical protein
MQFWRFGAFGTSSEFAQRLLQIRRLSHRRFFNSVFNTELFGGRPCGMLARFAASATVTFEQTVFNTV